MNVKVKLLNIDLIRNFGGNIVEMKNPHHYSTRHGTKVKGTPGGVWIYVRMQKSATEHVKIGWCFKGRLST